MMYTKGKLSYGGYNGRGGVCVFDENLNHIFTAENPNSLEPHKKNAKELVRRWNIYDELLEALKAVIWQHDNNNGVLCGMALQDARAAIAEAEADNED